MDEMRNRYRVERRDYTSPVRRPAAHHPAAPSVTPVAAPVDRQAPQPRADHRPIEPGRPHKRPKRRRFLRFFFILLILSALAGGGFAAYHKFKVKNPFPADIRQTTSVDLLYPTALPAGYKFDPTSLNQTNSILTYNARNGGQRLVFSLQKTPSGFDFTSFYKQQLQDLRQINTVYGQASVGRNSGRYLGSLVDGDTWLLLSTNNPQLNAADFNLVLNNLKKY